MYMSIKLFAKCCVRGYLELAKLDKNRMRRFYLASNTVLREEIRSIQRRKGVVPYSAELLCRGQNLELLAVASNREQDRSQ